MELTFISDTHGKHPLLKLGMGDILIHCGDFSSYGDLDEVEDFADFIAKQAFEHKIVIAGNHDLSFEDEHRSAAEALLHERGIIYLNDSGVTLNGYRFWGSPVQPAFCSWAFNRERGADIAKHWQQIPADTNILITHTPAYGYLDQCYNGESVGCEELAAVIERIQPQIHAFGHIHEGHGTLQTAHTLFVNACCLNEHYQLVHAPIRVALPSLQILASPASAALTSA